VLVQVVLETQTPLALVFLVLILHFQLSPQAAAEAAEPTQTVFKVVLAAAAVETV
jgi:hypothetical protein